MDEAERAQRRAEREQRRAEREQRLIQEFGPNYRVVLGDEAADALLSWEGPFYEEALYLSPEDERILDAIWDKIAARDERQREREARKHQKRAPLHEEIGSAPEDERIARDVWDEIAAEDKRKVATQRERRRRKAEQSDEASGG